MSNTPVKGAVNSEEIRDQPFDRKTVERAEALAARYRIRIERDQTGYAGTVTSLPCVFGHGPSKTAALDATRDLLKWTIAYLIETGRTPTPDD